MKHWEVMKAYEEGADIEIKNGDNWSLCPEPIWNWVSNDYRVKASKSKEELFKDNFHGKKIRLHGWDEHMYIISNHVVNNRIHAINQSGYHDIYIIDKEWELWKEPEYILMSAVELASMWVSKKGNVFERIIGINTINNSVKFSDGWSSTISNLYELGYKWCRHPSKKLKSLKIENYEKAKEFGLTSIDRWEDV